MEEGLMGKMKARSNKGEWDYLKYGMSSSTDASTFRKLLGDRHTTAATLLAREVIQNSEDASFMAKGDDGVPFKMDFQFITRYGADAEKCLTAMDFESLAHRLEAVGIANCGLPETKVREILRQNEVEPALKILAMSDFGAQGLAGDLELIKDSGWFNCLFSVGASEQKSFGAGGSYGFGKSAFVNGSLFSTVVVYTKSGPSSVPGSRQFGGVSYWNGYKYAGQSYTGMCAMGDPSSPFEWLKKPFTDDDADSLAELFGFPSRGDEESDWGTTIGILYPVVEQDDLISAIEEFWWPAFEGEKPKMSVTVASPTGYRYPVSPKSSEHHHFLPDMRKAFDLATGVVKPEDMYQYVKEIKTPSGIVVGTFAAVANPETCFDQKLPGSRGAANFSRIALTRKPRMIVQYLEYGKGAGSAPYVDGIFIGASDNHVEAALRRCEPAEHNLWWPTKSGDLRQFAKSGSDAEIALAVKNGIEDALDDFKNRLRPPDTKGKTLLKDFGSLLGKLLKDPGTGPAPQKPDPISIHFIDGPYPVETASGVKYTTVVEFGVEKKLAEEGGFLQLGFSYGLVTDEDGSGAPVACTIEVQQAPDGFDRSSLCGHLVGVQKVRLKVESAEVLHGQSLKAKPTARVMRQGAQNEN